ncbi:hypothetical protein EPUL_003068 [Erysiphe pulchra]|uniref:Aldehyde dehydrogenase domain-containing protein n=1 Tax=Erysiphe pulchra TaxID=225359 RepID=A0A2S4PTQ8_9PEZI|nr:hypothetical protein EPUL_003068 [Erysiphe pulchra]
MWSMYKVVVRRNFINNEWVMSSYDQKIIAINPTDESEITSVYSASAEDVDTAVAAARKAFQDPPWSNLEHTRS